MSVGERGRQAGTDVVVPALAADVVAGEVRIQPVVGEAEDRALLTWQEIEHAPGADPLVVAVDEPEFVLQDLPHHPLRPGFGYANPAVVSGAVAVLELVTGSAGTAGDAFGPPAPRVVNRGEDLVEGGGHGDVDAV